MPNAHMNMALEQQTGPQLVQPKRTTVTRKRGHSVPSTLTRQMREQIAAAISFGRSIPQTAKEYNADRCVVTEIWLRSEIASLREQVQRLSRRAA